jgi:hypothetical protein
VRSLTLTAEQEARRVKEAFILEEEQTAAEAQRLSCEVERISVEEAYTCEEERTLSEQAGEMESAIAVQAGSAMDKKTSIEAQRGDRDCGCDMDVMQIHCPVRSISFMTTYDTPHIQCISLHSS